MRDSPRAGTGLRAREAGDRGGDAAAAAESLTRRHFVKQDERPADVASLDLLTVDPSLRNLLFTDGTVTRTLEVQALSPVWVDVLDQQRTHVAGDTATGLVAVHGTEAIRRRVAIGVGIGAALIWAESHIVVERLPGEFLNVLGASPEGIGQSLRTVQLESWREMLWFGLDVVPSWAGNGAESRVLRRLYRVITLGRPAMLISESFAVERQAGSYLLAERGQSLRPRRTPRRSA
ncbi:MAG TPA: chorismate pyruvate-lyase family protein [Solirubrobacterales bacterium]|nr:chorismate pyruvate-lyase family protein [Solirubrobacterales bacterium]